MAGIRKISGKLQAHGVTLQILGFCTLAAGLTMGGVLWAHLYQPRFVLPIAAIFSVISLLAVGLTVRYLLLKPIRAFIDATQAIKEGRLESRVEIESQNEFGRLASSINQIIRMLEQRLNQVSIFNQISKESTLSQNLNNVLSLILGKAVETQQADAGSIMLIDTRSNELVVRAETDPTSKLTRQSRLPLGEGIAGWVAKEGRPIVMVDGVNDMAGFAQGEGIENAVSVPILLDRTVVGVLNLSYDKSAGKHKFAPLDLDYLTAMANHAAAAINNAQLFEELRSNYLSTVQALAAAIDAKDPYTHGHSARVAEYAVAAAQELEMTLSQMEVLQAAAYLHDIGKIGIPEPILRKPGKLTEEEFEIIKTHPEISARILSPVNFRGEVISIVKHHHERVDGHGYPSRVSGEAIPVEARILAVADSFDAMTSHRPYRPARTIEEAEEELLRCAGTQFDKKIVTAFIRAMEKTRVHDAPPATV